LEYFLELFIYIILFNGLVKAIEKIAW
jgi:hypothetical protein